MNETRNSIENARKYSDGEFLNTCNGTTAAIFATTAEVYEGRAPKRRASWIMS
jgi:hypothetical protein